MGKPIAVALLSLAMLLDLAAMVTSVYAVEFGTSRGRTGFTGVFPAVDLEVRIPARVERITVTGRNGAIEVVGVAGRLTLETRNGAINVRDFEGGVGAQTQNGAVTFMGRLESGSNSRFDTTN